MILEAFGSPWLITESAFKTLIAIGSRDSFFADVRKQALEARDGVPLKNARAAYNRGSVCVIPVVGPLIRHADVFSDVSGATSYAAIRKDLQLALDSASVTSILFSIDSPGGEANGCFELADAIYAARELKPVFAYVGGMGASAAYAIASACERITCAASAELGSIGVRAGYLDASRAMDNAGLKEWIFVSSQSPNKGFDPNVEDDRGRLQVVLDDLASVFVELVARNRDVGVDEVLEGFGKGDVMVGARAVDAGLADELGDFEGVLAEMTAMPWQPATSSPQLEIHMPKNYTTSTVGASSIVAQNAPPDRCDGCGKPMSGNRYCQPCYEHDDGDEEDDGEDDEEARALGLDSKATRVQRLERSAQLAEFERSVCLATKAGDAAAARGAVLAGALAIAEQAAALEQAKIAAHAALQMQFRTLLESRLSLGDADTVITLLPAAQQEGASRAVEGLATQTREGVVGAICNAVTVDEQAHKSVATFLGSRPALPTAHATPPLDEKNRGAVIKASDQDLARYGIKSDSLAKFGNIHSVADIHAAQKGQ
jgi:ClpP class serine protease